MSSAATLVLFASTSRPLTSQPVTLSLTDVEPGAQPNGSWVVRVYADSDFHIRTDGQDATSSDFPVKSGSDGIVVSVSQSGAVSVLKKSGAADSTAWFSRIKKL